MVPAKSIYTRTKHELIMESSSSGHLMRRNFLFVAMLLAFVFAMATPSQASLMNVSVVQEIRNTSYYTINDSVNSPINASNITFVQPELKINVTGNITTVYNFTLTVDGVQGQSYNITNNTAVYVNISTRLANGTHTVLVKINSTEDGNAQYNSTVQFFVDDTAPVINTSAGTGATTNATNTTDTTPEILFNLTDNAQTNQINVSVYVAPSGGSFTYDGSKLITNNTIGRFNLSARTNGTFIVRFEANDSARNLANASLFTIYVDDYAPVLNFTSGSTINATNFTDTTPELTVNITDNNGSFTLINVSLYIGSTFDHTELLTNNTLSKINITSARANGTFVIRLEANDSAGNLRNASLLTIRVDDTKSMFQPFNSGNGTTTNATNTSDITPEILVNLTDNAQTDQINVSVYVDSTYDGSFLFTNNTIGRFNISARRNDTTRIRFEANDSAGNLANASLLTLYVYEGKPTVNIISFAANATNTTSFTQTIIFNLSRTGNYTNTNFLNYTIFIDGTRNGTSEFVNNDTNITAVVTGFRNGTHNIWVQGIDPAGNIANSTVYTITTDTEAPYITIETPYNSTNTTDVTPQFQFRIIDNSTSVAALNWTIWVDGAVNGQTGLAANNTLVNVSLIALSNFTHNVTVQVKDFLNNSRNITEWKITTDAIAPALTVSYSPTTVYKGNVVTISCTTSDLLGISARTVTVTKPNGVAVASSCGGEFTDTTAGGTYTISFTANDTAGNGATITNTFVSNDAGGSSSSSSGGGGGGSSSAAASTPSTTASKTLIVDSFVPDKPNVVKLTSENIGFKEISVDIASKVNAVEIKVVKTDSAPAEVTKAVEGKVYQYIEIKHDKLTDNNIKSAKVKFTITKKWTADNGVSKANVVLKRFKDGSWTDMKTTLSSESSAEITYEAELPGLSVFAIGEAVPTAATQQQTTQQPVEQPSAQTGQQPAQGTTPSTPSAPSAPSSPGQPLYGSYPNETVYYAAGIIAILAVAYLLLRSRKKNKAKKK